MNVFLGIYWPFVCLLWRNLFRSFAHFKKRRDLHYGSLYTLETNPSSAMICTVFSHCVCHFSPSCGTVCWSNIFGIYKSTFLFSFLFVVSILCVGEYCLSQYFRDLYLYSLLRVRDFQLSYLLLWPVWSWLVYMERMYMGPNLDFVYDLFWELTQTPSSVGLSGDHQGSAYTSTSWFTLEQVVLEILFQEDLRMAWNPEPPGPRGQLCTQLAASVWRLSLFILAGNLGHQYTRGHTGFLTDTECGVLRSTLLEQTAESWCFPSWEHCPVLVCLFVVS